MHHNLPEIKVASMTVTAVTAPVVMAAAAGSPLLVLLLPAGQPIVGVARL